MRTLAPAYGYATFEEVQDEIMRALKSISVSACGELDLDLLICPYIASMNVLSLRVAHNTAQLGVTTLTEELLDSHKSASKALLKQNTKDNEKKMDAKLDRMRKAVQTQLTSQRAVVEQEGRKKLIEAP